MYVLYNVLKVSIICEQGFRKIDPDQWEFANEEFLRGQRHLLKNIHRRKPIHSHSLQNQGHSPAPLTEVERHEYEKEIKRLKNDKRLLQLELQKHTGEYQELEFQAQSLFDRFQNMERRQKQLITFVAEHLRKPEFTSILVQQSEIHNKRRKLLKSNHVPDEWNMEVIRNRKEHRDATPSYIWQIDQVEEKLQSSMEFWEDLICEICDKGQDVLQPCMLSEVLQVTEINGRPCSPKSRLSSPTSFEVYSSPEMVDAADHIDMNTKPAGVPEVVEASSKAQAVEKPTRVNDLFWEQCLTEAPAYCTGDVHENQLEKREIDSQVGDGKEAVHRNLWWNMNDVDNITKQMGHLTPAM